MHSVDNDHSMRKKSLISRSALARHWVFDITQPSKCRRDHNLSELAYTVQRLPDMYDRTGSVQISSTRVCAKDQYISTALMRVRMMRVM